MTSVPATIDVLIETPAWRRVVAQPERVARLAASLLDEEITIVLSCDRRVRALNARHRGIDKATNVLTFDPPAPGAAGEIVLALETVQREARAEGKSVADHLAHLVLHGGLHLLGYDHDHPGDARRMEMEEAWLMRQLGRPNPWKSRMMGLS